MPKSIVPGMSNIALMLPMIFYDGHEHFKLTSCRSWCHKLPRID